MTERTFEELPVVATMTPAERSAEMAAWGKAAITSCTFDQLHERIEQLVGRSVWTHEMGLNWRGLVDEAGTWIHPTFDEIVGLIPPEKLIIVSVDGEGR